jgi:DNA-binding SARP family transcriptional activator/DNA-binding CsgD family transcriptional regulator
MAVLTGGSSTDALRVQLLGPVRAWRGDAEVDLGTAGRRAVFAILALRANEVVSRTELVDGLWDEDPPTKAVGILHTYIYDLRRALDPARDKRSGSAVLTTIQSSYSLRLLPDQLDERRFATHSDRARQHWARGDLAAAVDALDTALALWQGEALQGVPGPFAQMQRARLTESQTTAVERRAALLLILGAPERVRGELSDLVTAAPLRETARGLLMVALHQTGQHDDAIKLYHDTERMLISELGLEPGPALRRIQQDVVAGRTVSSAAISAGIWTSGAAPAPDKTLALLERTRPKPPRFQVGRDEDVGWLRSFLPGLLAGRGDCVGVEGPPGIGKTAVVAAAFADPVDGCGVVWLTGDELVDSDPGSRLPGTVNLVERLCAEKPLVLVIDDLCSADHVGLLVWHRLCRLTQQLPLLLLGLFRTLPTRPELVRLRSSVSAVGGRSKTIEPLASDDITRFVERELGAVGGPHLRELFEAAAGNPLAATELLATVASPGAVHISAGVVELSQDRQPEFDEMAADLVRDQYRLLTPNTQEMLRWAAVLGMRFDLGDLAAVLHTSPADLVLVVDEAITVGMLDDNDEYLAFRHAFLYRALTEERPTAARAAQHRVAAEALASAARPVERVAAQLLGAAPRDAWTAAWLAHNIDTVTARAPITAMALLELTDIDAVADKAHHDTLLARRVRLAFRLGRRPAAARTILDTTDNPEYAAEMRWILAHLAHRSGDIERAIAYLRDATADNSTPASWRARCETLRAQFERGGLDDLESAKQTAGTALRDATSAADLVATADALKELWYIETVRRDHLTALGHADAALEVVENTAELLPRQLELLDNRTFSLQNLDRLEEAAHTLERMRAIGGRSHPSRVRPYVAVALHAYWLGRWDEAMGQLNLVPPTDPEMEVDDADTHTYLLRHGVAALITAHRGETDQLRALLRAAEEFPIITAGDQENNDFLLVARGVEAGITAGPTAELATLDPLLDMRYGRATLRHQWLPRLLSLAVDAGDRRRIAAAMRVCETEAEREVEPARAHWALRWCIALTGQDPEGLLDVARHYEALGRSVELAATLVDAAVVLCRRRENGPARRAFRDALALLTELGAEFDIERAKARLRVFGVDETGASVAHPVVPGWRSLSGLERRVAELVGAAKSNPEIAEQLALSRRDVQAHLSRIMQKLGLTARADLAEKIGKVVNGSVRQRESPEVERT